MPSGGELALHVVEFDAEWFDASAFATASIALTPTLARCVRRRQAEFFYGRLAARAALRELRAASLDIGIGAAGEPIWPAGYVGSISHIDGRAAAAAAPGIERLGLGIDIERTAYADAQDALRKVAVDGAELERLAAAAGPLSLDELVTLTFSAKESLYKGAYGTVGRFFGFEAARLRSVDMARQVLTLELAEGLHPTFFPYGLRCEIGFARLDARTFVTVFDARLTTVPV